MGGHGREKNRTNEEDQWRKLEKDSGPRHPASNPSDTLIQFDLNAQRIELWPHPIPHVMLKWKTFIKGQGLNEELLSFADRKIVKSTSTAQQNIDGNKVRETYDEIINEPSTSNSVFILKGEEVRVVHNSIKKTVVKIDTTSKEPKLKPTHSQLMKLCESDDYVKLSEGINNEEFDLDASDEFGWTLLMCAACAGSVNCVDILLTAGANWTLRDKTGNTALKLAQKKQKREVCELITRWVKAARGNNSDETRLEDNSHDHNHGDGESSKFCDFCSSNYTSERIHVKSIAHLVSTSKRIKDKVHYGIPESNKGFQLMLKTGWDREGGLGTEGQGQKFPVKTVLKRDRKGLGNSEDRKAARITHFAPFDTAAVENPYKHERLERITTLKKKEDLKRKSKEKVKEIKYRRELASI